MDNDQHGQEPRPVAPRPALRGLGPARPLENDDLSGRIAPGPVDRANGHRWADGWCDVSGLYARLPGSGVALGDIVVLDNLSSHKVRGVREAIMAARAKLLYLPPYSLDLNPIEEFFSKLKALLRKAATRIVDALWKEIGTLLGTLSPNECANYFGSCKYVNA